LIEGPALTIIVASMPLYLAAFFLYVIRGIKGPTVFDSTVAIDAMCYDMVAFMIILAVYFGTPLLLGAAILMALWAYILDVVIARYHSRPELEGGGS